MPGAGQPKPLTRGTPVPREGDRSGFPLPGVWPVLGQSHLGRGREELYSEKIKGKKAMGRGKPQGAHEKTRGHTSTRGGFDCHFNPQTVHAL